MNSLFTLLTSFHGRISRKQWWIGLVIIALADIAGGMLINPDYFFADQPPPESWLDTLWQIALLVPMTAITVKRFNDRDWPWWLGYAFGAVTVIISVAPHFGLRVDPGAGGVGATAFWLAFAVLLFAFVDNGFFRGTQGPNRFGPDPLAGAPQPA
jgi:uncharacterized membrane protein YhaH (DUF805 family)